LEFVEKMGERYLPDTPHKEQPQQRNTIRASDPRILLKKAAAALDCNPDEFIGSGRVFGSAKINRDLLRSIGSNTPPLAAIKLTQLNHSLIPRPLAAG